MTISLCNKLCVFVFFSSSVHAMTLFIYRNSMKIYYVINYSFDNSDFCMKNIEHFFLFSFFNSFFFSLFFFLLSFFFFFSLFSSSLFFSLHVSPFTIQTR